MDVVRPPCTSARSQAARCRYRSGTYPRISSPAAAGGYPDRCAGLQRRSSAVPVCVDSGDALMIRRSRCSPTPEPPTVTMQTFSSSRKPNARARSPSSRGCRASDVAAEIEVLLGPGANLRQVPAKGSGTMSAALPTKMERSRTRGSARCARAFPRCSRSSRTLALAAFWHGHVADKVREPTKAARLSSGCSCQKWSSSQASSAIPTS